MRRAFPEYFNVLCQVRHIEQPAQLWVGLLICASVLCSCLEPGAPESATQNDAAATTQMVFDSESDRAVIQDAIVLERDRDVDMSRDSAVIDQELDLEVPVDMLVDLGPSSGPYTTAQVDDIFQRGCGSCHNSTASPPLGGGVAAWINRGSGQSPLPLIVPGNHQRSYLYHKLADTHRDPPSNGRGTGMPMGRQLYSESRLERIAGWIDNL